MVDTHIPEACVLLHSNIQSTSPDVDALVDPETQLQSVIRKPEEKVTSQNYAVLININQANHKQ